MRRHRVLFSLLFLFVQITFSIIPAKKGITVPIGLQERMNRIRNSYSNGYWANKFDLRRNQKIFEKHAGVVTENRRIAGIDTINIPVLLGNYSDVNPIYSQQDFQSLLFDGPNPTGTLTDYYLENSYNQLCMTGTVRGWFRLPRSFAYYVHDGGDNAGLEYGGPDFAIDLVFIADNTIDFSEYIDPNSLDSEGYHVTQLGIVHTGGDAAAGADNIWSHRWSFLYRLLQRKNDPSESIINKNQILPSGHYRTNDFYLGKPVVIDGDYAIQPELRASSNTSGGLVQIGVFCHEFGHILGLPDLYDTDYSSEGLGTWCLMAAGSYGGDGRHEDMPAHMSAWCKVFLGWIDPSPVSTFLKDCIIPAVQALQSVFKLSGGIKNPNEYFLVENRQKIGFDRYLQQDGLLIYHIDELQLWHSDNNNENHYLVDLMQADGLRHLNMNGNSGDSGDPFPGTTDNKRFDGYTTPNSKDYNNSQTYVGVRNISASGDTMYADFDIGSRPYLFIRKIGQKDSGQISENGRIEPNEKGKLTLQIENIHPVAADNVALSMQCSGEGITIEPSVTSFSMSSLAVQEIIADAHVLLEANFIPREVTLQVDIQAESYHEIFPVTVTLGYPKLLILDGDSVEQTSLVYYKNSLDTIKKFYEVQRVTDSLYSDATLAKRKAILFFSGAKKTETISNSVIEKIDEFIQQGGNVLISGQNIAEDMHRRSLTALTNVFHVRWSKNQLIGRIVYGAPSDMIGSGIHKLIISGNDGAANQLSPDVLLTDDLSFPFLSYGSVGSGSIAGIHFENKQTNSKVVFLGFGLEAINNISSETSRSSVLQQILDWFDAQVTVKDQNQNAIFNWKLQSAYPNPFNVFSRINYEVGQNGYVEIALFNILGQRVQTIVSSERSAGKYEAIIDGSRLSSGVFFCRLMSSNYKAYQKILLLK